MGDGEYTLGEFRLMRRLGVGGMAEVWAATHRTFGGEAAVKVMLGRVASNEMLREAFVAEARSHAGLDHPHIVRLLDYGDVSEGDIPPRGVLAGDAYLVMELAAGTLRDDALPSSWDEVHAVLTQCLRGLAYSHARGFIHRDLKPENVLRFGSDRPTYKLADFGIAHSINLDETADRDTLSVTVGTPHYMAPEQFRGQWFEFGPATDLYALGCLAYELVCGRVPYPQTSLMALATAHLNAPIPTLEPRFEVPARFAEWVRFLLQKRPRDRFRFAADAAFALQELSQGFHPSASEVGAAISSRPIVAEHDAATVVDALSELMVGETLDAIEVDVAPAAAAAGGGAPAVTAPFPPEWKTQQRSEASPGLGLGLLALREAPVVGFDEMRDELWAVIAEVVQQHAPRVVVLRGSDNAPISELGTWLWRRVGETGAAVTHDVFYTRAGGPREGLVALLEDAFGTWGMHDDEAGRQIADFVNQRVRPEVALSCGEITADLVLSARGVEERQLRVPSRGERHRAVAEVLTTAAAGRPYLASISDAQWGRDAFAFARCVLEQSEPAVVVLGVVGELDAQTAQQLEALIACEGARVIEVREPTADEGVMLARAMLPLEDSTAAQLVELSRGEEVVLRLLLDGLQVTRGLEPGRDGYHLAQGVVLPSTRAEVFTHAVSRCVAANGDILRGLEAAAVLGRAPDPGELRAVLSKQAGNSDALRSALVEHGLARAVGERWWFVHDAVVDVVQQTARGRGRWEELNLCCAEALLERAGQNAADLLTRAAQHFVAAGRPADALAPMFKAMRMSLGEDVLRTQGLLATYDEICAELALDETHPARLDAALVRMVLLRIDGRVDASRALAAATVEAAQRQRQPAALGFALRHLARLEIASRALTEAAELLHRAEAAARDEVDPGEQAASARVLGQVYDQLGDFDASIDALSRAVRLYGEVDDAAAQGRVMALLASVLGHAGRLDEARDWGERALRLGRRIGGVGAGEASNILGDIARLSQDFGQARERYLEARSRFALGASFNLQIVDLNLAGVDLAEGRVQQATDAFQSLRRAFEAVHLVHAAAIASAGLAACAAIRGDHAVVTEQLADVAGALDGAPDVDIVELLEIGFTNASSQQTRLQLAHVLATLHRGLGNLERAAVLAEISR